MWTAVKTFFTGIDRCLCLLHSLRHAQDAQSLLLLNIFRKVKRMSADIDALNDRQTALEAKIDEANATLSQLATTVLDLRNLIGNTQRLEEAVRHAATRAEKMLNSLAAAEDAADDALAAPPAEPPAA